MPRTQVDFSTVKARTPLDRWMLDQHVTAFTVAQWLICSVETARRYRMGTRFMTEYQAQRLAFETRGAVPVGSMTRAAIADYQKNSA